MDAWGTTDDLILFSVIVALALVGCLVMLWRERQR
jgi:hypothetical protein